MAKRVRFAEVNAGYSPKHPTPSPSLSSSSLPSSSDPPTPPVKTTPLIHPRSTYKVKLSPLPSPPLDEMHIHFLLAFTPFGAPALLYHITTPPTFLLGSQMSPDTFHEPATEPSLRSLTIIYPSLLSPITVISGDVGHVTLSDVLHAVYHQLRIPTTTAEYKSLHGDTREYVDIAYFLRCKHSGDETRQLKRGVKRVDLLMGRNRFFGLSATLHGPDIWELNIITGPEVPDDTAKPPRKITIYRQAPYSVDWNQFYCTDLLMRRDYAVEVIGLIIHRYFGVKGCIIPIAFIPEYTEDAFVFTIARPCDVEGKRDFYIFTFDSPLNMTRVNMFRPGFSSVLDFYLNRRPGQLEPIERRPDREAKPLRPLSGVGFRRVGLDELSSDSDV
ncbi:hypothetical protein DXG03_004770 [Asterophora parasitica]|uniref:DUF6699 domain-containing protein n=1 Tax=Asterophora parasitica TaxID=117018 RepID=A0A9P7GC31_9AGAR|nr:hypothetical protein DXG03_004770 [Asterophora parasitica]